MKKTDEQGFTLVELLVVIAIIGILAGLLLPAISTGAGGRCQSNLRQITMSYSIAVSDNSDQFGAMPTFRESKEQNYKDLGSWSTLEGFWENNYGLRGNGWICPSAPPRKTPPYNSPDWFETYGGLHFATTVRQEFDDGVYEREYSYVYNAAFDGRYVNALSGAGNPEASSMKPFTCEADVQQPSCTPIWGDGYDSEAVRLASEDPPWTINPDRAIAIDFALPRHAWRPNGIAPNSDFDRKSKLPGATNLSFADGHVQTVPLEKLWSYYWHRDYVPPAKRPGTE